MRFSTAIALAAAVPALVSAEVHTVNVGANMALAFDPPSTTAVVGDSVTFVFQSKNHSVTQSTFAAPCTRSNLNNVQGFGSGFQPVAAGAAQMPTFTINVTSTDPIWFYCGQKIPLDHCNAGMVGAVNAPPDKTVDQFKAAAMAAAPAAPGASSAPGAPAASGAPPAASGASGAAPAASSAPAAPPASGAMRLSSGAAGALTLLGLMVGLAL